MKPVTAELSFDAIKILAFIVEYITQKIVTFIEYEIIGEVSQISTNQKRESTVSWLLIGRNLRPFPDNTGLYCELYLNLVSRYIRAKNDNKK